MRKIRNTAVCGIIALSLSALGLTGCGNTVDGTATAVTVNGETLNMGTANYILRYSEATMNYMMTSYGFAEAGSLWSQEVEDGVTYGENYKSEIETSIEDMMLLSQNADEYGVVISDEDTADMQEVGQEVYDTNQEVMDQIGVTADDIANAARLYVIKSRIYDPMVADTDQDVSDEEAAQSTITYCRIRIATEDDDEGNTADELNALYQEQIQEVLDEALASDNPSTFDIETAAEEINEDFYTSEYSFGDDDTAMPDEMKEDMASMEDGEVSSKIYENDSFYYIFRLEKAFDREATDNNKLSIISDREQENYESKLAALEDAAEVTWSDEWNALTLTDANTYTSVAADTESTEG